MQVSLRRLADDYQMRADEIEHDEILSAKGAGENERARAQRIVSGAKLKRSFPSSNWVRCFFGRRSNPKNRRTGRKMSDAIFIAKKASGRLSIGDKREIDRAGWRKPRGLRLTATSRYIRDELFPKR